MYTQPQQPRSQSKPIVYRLQLWICLLFLPLVLVATIFTAQQTYGQAGQDLSCDNKGIMVDECEALKALYLDTDGKNWLPNTGWFETGKHPCADWAGIICENNSVVQIQLIEHRLKGRIPITLANLSKLRVLNLGNLHSSHESSNPANLNKLEGEFPTWITKTRELSALGLHRTGLTVRAFPDLRQMPKFDRLYVEGIYLAHEWPSLLDKLPISMTELFLRNTGLTGAIPIEPTELRKFTQLRLLFLDKNRLDGQIPEDLGSFGNLQELDLSYNQLSGMIPEKVACLSTLSQLNLGQNKLSAIGQSATCLISKDSDWADTQTVPPIIAAPIIKNHSAGFTMNITPITFTVHGGGYEIGCRESAASPGVDYPIQTFNPDKNAITVTAKLLRPDTDYTCAVRTKTEPHSGQQSTLVSEWSAATVTHTPTINLLSLYALAFDSNLNNHREEILQSIQATTANDPEKVAVVLIDGIAANDTEIVYMYGNTRELVTRNFAAGVQTGPEVGLPKLVAAPGANWDLQETVMTTATLNMVSELANALKTGTVVSAALDQDNQLKEYNMANPLQLGAFIKWARTTFERETTINVPGTKTTFTYIGHGIPLAPAGPASNMEADEWFASDPTGHFTGTFPLPSKQDITPGSLSRTDHSSASLISPYALAEALRIGTDHGEKPLTVLDIVHCFGATIEELYELSNPGGKPFAEVIVGSPNYAYAGALVVEHGLTKVQPAQSAEQMGVNIIAAYDEALQIADASDDGVNTNVEHPRVMVAVRSALIPAIKNHIDTLSLKLLNRITDTLPLPQESIRLITALEAAHTNSTNYDTTFCGIIVGRPQDWDLNQEDALSDLYEFVSNLQNELVNVPGDVTEIRKAITSIQDAIAQAVIATIRVSGTPYFATGDVYWPFGASIKGIAMYTDFVGIQFKPPETTTTTVLGWQAYWYVTNEGIPYAFTQGEHTWGHLFAQFWKTKMAANRESGDEASIKLFACDVDIPLVRHIRWIYLPSIHNQ